MMTNSIYSYSGQLKNKRSTCVPEHEFHLKTQHPVNNTKTVTTNNVKKETKQETNNVASTPVTTKSPPPKEKKDNILKPRPPAETNENSSEKKKEPKNDSVRTTEKKEKTTKTERNHVSEKVSTKSDSKSSSIPNSPRKGDHRGRSAEPPVETERGKVLHHIEPFNLIIRVFFIIKTLIFLFCISYFIRT